MKRGEYGLYGIRIMLQKHGLLSSFRMILIAIMIPLFSACLLRMNQQRSKLVCLLSLLFRMDCIKAAIS